MPELKSNQREELSRRSRGGRICLQHRFDSAPLEISSANRGTVQEDIAHIVPQVMGQPSFHWNRETCLFAVQDFVRDALLQRLFQNVFGRDSVKFVARW